MQHVHVIGWMDRVDRGDFPVVAVCPRRYHKEFVGTERRNKWYREPHQEGRVSTSSVLRQTLGVSYT